MKKFATAVLLGLLPCVVSQAASIPVRVASLSTVLTEVAQKIGGAHVVVTGLVKPGIDPHEYEPKPADIAVIADSQLILASGKHLEGYLSKLPESSGTRGTMLEVGDHLPSLEMKPEEGEAHGPLRKNGLIEDPHWWNSIANLKLAAEIVRDELSKIDPADAPDYQKNAADYLDELNALEKWAKLKVAELPRDRRKLVTSHDAFQYFARDFGFTISAIEGLSPEDEPSNGKVISMIDEIKREHVKAIFGEFGNNPKVVEAITHDSGAKIGGELYADGLGLGEAGTYAGMVRHNLNTIVDTLK